MHLHVWGAAASQAERLALSMSWQEVPWWRRVGCFVPASAGSYQVTHPQAHSTSAGTQSVVEVLVTFKLTYTLWLTSWNLHIRNSFAAAKIEKFNILTLLCKCPVNTEQQHI